MRSNQANGSGRRLYVLLAGCPGESPCRPPSRDQAIATLRRVVELGVNFIDTADSYGPSVSEGLIAEALYPYPDELVIVKRTSLPQPSS